MMLLRLLCVKFIANSRNDVMFVSVRSAEFSDFIAKCLVKDPDLRSSASDLLEVVCCI